MGPKIKSSVGLPPARRTVTAVKPSAGLIHAESFPRLRRGQSDLQASCVSRAGGLHAGAPGPGACSPLSWIALLPPAEDQRISPGSSVCFVAFCSSASVIKHGNGAVTYLSMNPTPCLRRSSECDRSGDVRCASPCRVSWPPGGYFPGGAVPRRCPCPRGAGRPPRL